MKRIVPCLWFDNNAEEAANFYASVFKNSRVGKVSRYGEAGFEIHGKPPGTVLTIEFEIDGQPFTALNGGPMFRFNEAVSFMVNCETQEEVDYYWERLSQGGDKNAQRCGWLKDKFGVSWQILPRFLGDLLSDPDKSDKVMAALLQMEKLDIATLKRVYDES